MSYQSWQGQFLQLLSLSSQTLSIVPGNSVTLPGGGGSASNWWQYPAQGIVDFSNNFLSNCGEISGGSNTNSLNIVAPSNLTLQATSNIGILPGKDLLINYGQSNGRIITNLSTLIAVGAEARFNLVNAPNIVASTITTNTLNAISTIHSISSISSSVLAVPSLLGVSSINGLPYAPGGSPSNWAQFPCNNSTIGGNGAGLSSIGSLDVALSGVGSFQVYDSNGFYQANMATPANRFNQISVQHSDTGQQLAMIMSNNTPDYGYLTYSENGILKGSLNFTSSTNAYPQSGGMFVKDEKNTTYMFADGAFQTNNVEANSNFGLAIQQTANFQAHAQPGFVFAGVTAADSNMYAGINLEASDSTGTSNASIVFNSGPNQNGPIHEVAAITVQYPVQGIQITDYSGAVYQFANSNFSASTITTSSMTAAAIQTNSFSNVGSFSTSYLFANTADIGLSTIISNSNVLYSGGMTINSNMYVTQVGMSNSDTDLIIQTDQGVDVLPAVLGLYASGGLYGKVNILADTDPTGITGGLVQIQANSGTTSLSRINVTAATTAIQAGAVDMGTFVVPSAVNILNGAGAGIEVLASAGPINMASGTTTTIAGGTGVIASGGTSGLIIDAVAAGNSKIQVQDIYAYQPPTLSNGQYLFLHGGSNGFTADNAVGIYGKSNFQIGSVSTLGFIDTGSTMTMEYNSTLNRVQVIDPVTSTNSLAYLSEVQFRDANELYVSANGNNTTGNGSANAPYATIQFAITQAELTATTTNPFVIYISPGIYTENLTFTKGCVALQAPINAQDKNTITQIVGTISIAVNANADLFNNQVIFSGLQMTSITDTSTVNHTLLIQDCKLFGTGRQLYVNSSSADQRTYLNNCDISSGGGTSPIIEIANGQLQAERCDIGTNQAAINCLVISGDALIARLALCAFENTNASGTLVPLISISSSSTALHSIGNCTFSFSTPAVRTGSINNTAVQFNTGAVNPLMIFVYNVISLLGTTDAANQYINKAAGMTGVPTVTVGQTSAIPSSAGSTTSLGSGIAFIPMTDTLGAFSTLTVGSVTGNVVNTQNLNASSYVSTITVDCSVISTSYVNINPMPLGQGMITTNGYGNIISNQFLLSPVGYLTTFDGVDATPADQNQGAINIFPTVSSIGLYTIPNGSHKLDVNGGIKATKISNFSTIISDYVSSSVGTISSMTSPVGLNSVPYGRGTGVGAIVNYDGYGTGYGHYQGTQGVMGGYYAVTDSSLGGGIGSTIFWFQPLLSSLMTITATYYNNSATFNPNHPIWIGNTVADANNLLSTITIFGQQNSGVQVSYMGFV